MVVLLGIITTEITRPKPINWKPSYTATDKIPFGCYVLHSELPNLFPNQEIVDVNASLYESFVTRDTLEQSNYLMINNGVDLDEQEYDQLLSYVSQGNDVFMASSYFGYYLSDTLNVSVEANYNVQEDTIRLSMTNSKFKNKDFLYTKGMYNRHFSSVDTLNTTILGHITFLEEKLFEVNEDLDRVRKLPNFIKVKFGNGHFYLNCTPLAFTNFYMLENNEDYVAQNFAYLKNKKTLYWDNYKKSGRVVIKSPLRFVLTQLPLKWAYYVTLVALLLFYIFRTKRQQRSIPVIEPLQNSSIEFAQTVGNLYYQHKDYSNLISKKLNYFLEYIRSKYHLDTTTINAKTAKDLAAKSGASLSDTTELIDFIKHLKNKQHHTENEMIALNKKITAFKR